MNFDHARIACEVRNGQLATFTSLWQMKIVGDRVQKVALYLLSRRDKVQQKNEHSPGDETTDEGVWSFNLLPEGAPVEGSERPCMTNNGPACQTAGLGQSFWSERRV